MSEAVVCADSSHLDDAMRGMRRTSGKLAKYPGRKIREDEEKAAQSGIK